MVDEGTAARYSIALSWEVDRADVRDATLVRTFWNAGAATIYLSFFGSLVYLSVTTPREVWASQADFRLAALAFFAVVLLALPVFALRAADRAFSLIGSSARHRLFRISPQHLYVSDATAEATVPWPSISKAFETVRCLYLEADQPRVLYQIPKRAIGDAMAVERIRLHLEDVMGDKARLGPPFLKRRRTGGLMQTRGREDQ